MIDEIVAGDGFVAGRTVTLVAFTGVRAIVITGHGPPEVLEVQERPDPQPGPARC